MSFIFLRNRVTGGAAFSPASLFSSGEEGAWYEPSTTTCFTATWTGSAFTGIAAAGYGDRVAIMEDQSGNGNDATQSNPDARPILARVPEGGRRNELSETDTLAAQSVTVTAAERTLSFTGTGTVTLTGASTAGPLVGTGAGDRVSLTFTPSAGSLTLTVLGTVTDAQLELGASATTYQSVADSLGYDITEAGVTSLEYLAFDGSDDFLGTGVDANTWLGTLSGADNGYLVVGGVQFDTATTNASLFNRSAFFGDIFGYFGMWADNANGGEAGIYHWSSNAAGSAQPYSVGGPAVITGRRDPTAGANGTIYGSVNGLEAAGTGVAALNQSAGSLTIGRHFNTFMNGRVFSLIVRGANTGTSSVDEVEAYVAGKTGVTL